MNKKFNNREEMFKSFLVKDGSLRDIVVENTTKQDWISLLLFLQKSNYELVLIFAGEKIPLPDNIIDLLNNNSGTKYLRIISNKITFGCPGFYENEIEIDLDPREFTTVDDYNEILILMQALNKLLNKQIKLFYEGERENPFYIVQ